METKHIGKICAALACACALSASAQTLHSSYFMESMVDRHELNPAFAPETGFVVVPVLGGMQAGVHSNVGMSNFVFLQPDGSLVNCFSPQVSAQEFLDKMPSASRIAAEVELPLISVGFNAWGGFNTIGIKERSFAGVNVPTSLFEFLKLGQDDRGVAHYDIDNISAYVDSYLEIALGHQRRLEALEGFSYGAKVKFLVGAIGGSVDIDKLDVNLSQERWYLESHGSMQLSSGMQFEYDQDGNITDITMESYRLGGFGMGFDLGAAYTPQALPDLTVSLALTDLGFMSWSNMAQAVTGGTFEYTGFDEIGAPGQPEAEEQINAVLDDLVGVINNVSTTNTATVTNSLRTTLNIGAEYAILDRKISFGLLSSTRFGKPFTYAEGMAVVNFRPLKWLHMVLNGSVSSYGGAMGALINVCPKGINLFLGCDYISFNSKFGAQGIPVNGMNFNLKMGLAFKFGYKKATPTVAQAL